jgi:hypothetical protein
MPSLITYLAAGAFVVLAMDAVAPPVGIGLPALAWPSVRGDAQTQQTVNRAGKGDRLPLPLARKSLRPAPPSPRILVGCEPVFSPLSAAARSNHSGRCVAAIANKERGDA